MNELVKKLRSLARYCEGREAILVNEAADAVERQAKHIDELQAKLHCMCGSPVDHSPWEGHSPVSMFDHAVEQEVQRRIAVLSSQ